MVEFLPDPLSAIEYRYYGHCCRAKCAGRACDKGGVLGFMNWFSERFAGNLRGDLFGGVTAGIVALPLALGFGVASGLENGAAAGLYGAIAVGLFASLFGGTPSQISGPTGPMTVVMAGVVGALTGDIAWLFAMVALSGALQVLLGLLRLGRYINYVPYPVISGFMSG